MAVVMRLFNELGFLFSFAQLVGFFALSLLAQLLCQVIPGAPCYEWRPPTLVQDPLNSPSPGFRDDSFQELCRTPPQLGAPSRGCTTAPVFRDSRWFSQVASLVGGKQTGRPMPPSLIFNSDAA